MDISFELFDIDNKDHITMGYKWLCDSSINYLYNPQFDDKDFSPPSYDKYYKIMERRVSQNRNSYIIKIADKIVGECDIDYSFDMLLKNDEPTAWISLVIGESTARGLGVGEKTILFLENCAKSRNIMRIELGVFEFNNIAIGLYEKLGYKKFGVVEDFIYLNGIKKSDYRYEKYLNK